MFASSTLYGVQGSSLFLSSLIIHSGSNEGSLCLGRALWKVETPIIDPVRLTQPPNLLHHASTTK